MEVDEPEVVENEEEEEKEDHESDQDSARKPFLSGYNTLEDYSKALLSGMFFDTIALSGDKVSGA